MEVFKNKVNETAALLAKYTDKHVDPDFGITNKLLDSFGKEICEMCVMYGGHTDEWKLDGDVGNVRFKGVFNVDRLPEILRHCAWVDDPFSSFIVNLGRDDEKFPSGHFVAILIRDGKIFYIDSFGLPPPKDNEPLQKSIDILEFHHERDFRKHRKFGFNKLRFQSLTSKACGLFALCYVVLHDLRLESTDITWHTTDLSRNDNLVIKTLRSLINKIKVT